MATAEVQPKALLEQLANAIKVSTSDSVVVNDTIHLGIDHASGRLCAAGRGRFAAVLDQRLADNVEGSDSVILDPSEVEDMVKEIRAAKLSGARDFRVGVQVDSTGLTVSATGEEQWNCKPSELTDEVQGDEESLGIYEELFQIVEETRTWEAPVAMTMNRHILKLAMDMKPGTPPKPDDMIQFLVRPEGPELNGIATIRIGPVRLYGMVAEVE